MTFRKDIIAHNNLTHQMSESPQKRKLLNSNGSLLNDGADQLSSRMTRSVIASSSKQSDLHSKDVNETGAWDSPESRPRRAQSSRTESGQLRKTTSKSRLGKSKSSDHGESAVIIVPKKLDKQFKRVADIEKLAK